MPHPGRTTTHSEKEGAARVEDGAHLAPPLLLGGDTGPGGSYLAGRTPSPPRRGSGLAMTARPRARPERY